MGLLCINMKLFTFDFVCVLFVVLVPSAYSSVKALTDNIAVNNPLPVACLRCLSHVLTGNNLMGCTGDSETDTCGLFKLTQRFWDAAFYIDTPSHSDANKYKACALNSWCAVETIQRYVERYLHDCRKKETKNTGVTGLARTTCESALGLILHGKDSCNQPISDNTLTRLRNCLHKQMWQLIRISD